jgi:hypothetical protein
LVVEHKAQRIRARFDGGHSVGQIRDAADFDFNRHLPANIPCYRAQDKPGFRPPRPEKPPGSVDILPTWVILLRLTWTQ